MAVDVAVADHPDLLAPLLTTYGTAVLAMGSSACEACPSLGDDLKRRSRDPSAQLSIDRSPEVLATIDGEIEGHVKDWGRRAAQHHRERAAEVKELLLTMARTAESVGSRDQRYASRMGLVTARLRQIATLDDVADIRASVEKGAAELKDSIARMTAEGQEAVADFRQQVKTYRVKLEDAAEQAWRDPLTGVRSRAGVERLIEERIAAGPEFCVAMLDIDGFKQVNDTHRHSVGDELLKKFAAELRSVCRQTDVVGRCGGDEFVLSLDCDLAQAAVRTDRLTKWACGAYTIDAGDHVVKLRADASVGLAAHRENESLQAMIARSDAAMYERKTNAQLANGLDVVQAPQAPGGNCVEPPGAPFSPRPARPGGAR